MKKVLFLSLLLTVLSSSSFAQVTLYSQSFASGLTPCTTIDYTGNGTWIYAHNPINDPSYGSVDFASPTQSNGFALILSDGVTGAINTDLITPAINCTSQSYVALKFDQFLNIYQNGIVAQVMVSTDSVTWTQVFDGFQDFVNSGGAATDPELVQVNISSIAANQPTVWVKFNYQGTNDLWWAVDDIKVFTLPGNDVSLDSVAIPDYMVAQGGLGVQANITNLGGQTLTSLQLAYTVNGGTPVTQTFTGLSVASFTSTTLQFTTPATLDSVAAYNISVVATLPNDSPDINPANNTGARSIVTLTQMPNRNVLLEEFSTILCGYCPGGLTKIEQIEASTDSAFFIPVTIHAGFGTDIMTTADDNTIAAAFTDAAPTANIDREMYTGSPIVAIGVSGLGANSPNEWQTAVEAEEAVVSPVSIAGSNTYDSATRQLTVTVTSKFYGPATGNFKMNCYIIEDSVTGPNVTNYGQHSYYYQTPTTGNPWLGVGTYDANTQTATIAGYVQHHVERKLMNGVWGTATTTGNIPGTTTAGESYSQTYTYTLPTTWRANFISLVAFVNQYNTDYTSEKNVVWNAVRMPLNGADSTNNAVPTAIKVVPSDFSKISLFPNPAQDIVTLAYTLDNDAKLSFEIYNSIGQLVSVQAQGNYYKGTYSTTLRTNQLANGLYFVTIKAESGAVQTLKFVIAK